ILRGILLRRQHDCGVPLPDMQTLTLSDIDVVLDSPGGDPTTAMTIGRLFRKYNVSVSVPVRGECISACVLMLAGGTHRSAWGPVGIHRPYFVDARTRSPEEIRQDWRQLRHDLSAYLE